MPPACWPKPDTYQTGIQLIHFGARSYGPQGCLENITFAMLGFRFGGTEFDCQAKANAAP
jgi:hypothetical protein